MQRTEYEVHPAANIFPMMTESEFDAIKEDISRHGCREPIVLFEGKLIDGRNRLKACNELGIEPMDSELIDEVDPIAYVMSANLHRRHLTTSQLCMCAAKVATLKNGSNQHKKEGSSNDEATCTRDDAAKMFSVSTASVDRAKEVIEHGSQELVEAVSQGTVKVSSAEKLVRKTTDKREQNRLVKEGAKAVREAVRSKPKPTKPSPPKSSPPTTDKDRIASALSAFDQKLVVARVLFEQCLPGIRKMIHRTWGEWLEEKS